MTIHRRLTTLCQGLVLTLLLGACGNEPFVETRSRPDTIGDRAALSDAALSSGKIAPKTSTAQQPSMALQAELSRAGPPVRLAPLPCCSDQDGALRSTEQYQPLTDSAVMRVADQSTSTFSIDVDTGAYANVRRFLNHGQLPPADAVRIEELINYFDYDYRGDADREQPFSLQTRIGPSPWNANTRLLQIGIRGYATVHDERPPANLVFLVDVSGSMNSPDKLGLLKASLGLLSAQLDERDSVAIVVYAGASGVVLEPTPGNRRAVIESALQRLTAGGSTNGEAGIRTAYTLAREHFEPNGVNRVILATDGDFNVGLDDVDTLKRLIERERRFGIALTTLGFGSGNYNDHLMEQLADVGNGNHAYIDALGEARKVLVDELTATLVTIASDVKIQIEFNPAVVSEYRLIGYVNRQLDNVDFANDKVDAGEIGAGHTVTALYEIALADSDGQWHSPERYASSTVDPEQPAERIDELAELRLRYKLPGEQNSRLIRHIVRRDHIGDSLAGMPSDYRFAVAVAGFGQLLRDGRYLVDFDFAALERLAGSAVGEDPYGYRAEFVRLVRLADALYTSTDPHGIQRDRQDSDRRG